MNMSPAERCKIDVLNQLAGALQPFVISHNCLQQKCSIIVNKVHDWCLDTSLSSSYSIRGEETWLSSSSSVATATDFAFGRYSWQGMSDAGTRESKRLLSPLPPPSESFGTTSFVLCACAQKQLANIEIRHTDVMILLVDEYCICSLHLGLVL